MPEGVACLDVPGRKLVERLRKAYWIITPIYIIVIAGTWLTKSRMQDTQVETDFPTA